MHPSVIDAFPLKFSAPLEGCTRSPYLDVKGLLTVGIGCLIDPPETALTLPWEIDGQPAPVAEVLAQLRALKAQQGLARYAWNTPAVLGATTMRLTDAGVMDLATTRLLAGEPLMRKAFPAWDSWPADAQLYACSMGWAIGFGWPAIFGNCAHLLQQTPAGFLLAAEGPSDIRTDGNPGIVPRNAQNRLCLSNAQLVQDRGLDPSTLYWPSTPLLLGTS